MRYLVSFALGFALTAGLWLAWSGWHGAPSPVPFADEAAVRQWMARYYVRPDADRLLRAMRVLDRAGALTDERRLKPAAAFVGAIIARDDASLDRLTQGAGEGSASFQRLLAQAIAASGRRDWRRLLTVLRRRLPARSLEVETLLAEPGEVATLALPLDEAGVTLEMLRAHFAATGSEAAIMRIIGALEGLEQEAQLAPLLNGYKAKEMLALLAGEDARVMQLCRREAGARSETTRQSLRAVVRAAETGDPGQIRRDAETAIRTWKGRQG